VLYHEECTYGEGNDRRKPVSKAYVAALENRVKELEALLHSQPVASTSRPSEPPEDEATLGLSHLKVSAPTQNSHGNTIVTEVFACALAD
jgi:hypothetical protein